MLALVILVSLVLAYLLVNLITLFIRNQKAFRFFANKCPDLPTVPNPSLFSGHMRSIIMNDNGWKIITDLHEKYGPSFGMFYVEQPWVATKDLDLIKLIEIDEAKKHPNRAFLGGPLRHFNNSIFQIFDGDWRGTRQVVAPALTSHVVKGDEVTASIEIIVGQFASSLRRKLEESKQAGNNSFELEVRNASERFTLAVVILVSYKQNDMIDFDAEQDRWTELFAKGSRDGSSPTIVASIMFPFLRNMFTILARYSPFGIWEANLVEYIQGAIEEKKLSLKTEMNDSRSAVKQLLNSKGTLLDTVIGGYLAKKLKYEHFIGSLLLLIMAGQITTADTLSCLIWQLAMNPDIQERLRKSLEEDGIGSEYLSWCINETIRWHPAVPLGTGRILGEDVTVNGQYLAKGTFVMPSTHSIHHDASIWPEPERFNPDRWRDQASFHAAAFVGFGLGPRNCVGRHLAVQEVKIVIKMLLSEYRIGTCDKTPLEWRFRVPAMLYTIMDEPLVLKFTPLISS